MISFATSMDSKMLIISVFSVMMILKSGKCEVYTVGDADEWNSEVNYGSWSHKYNFSVGDILVFKYAKEQHNVYEVTEAIYRSCNASSGVLAKYESGDDEILLKEAKLYSFICNIEGHCLGGMRFIIDVKQANSNTTPSPNTSPNTSPPPQPQKSSSCKTNYSKWNFGIYFATIWMLSAI